MIRRDAPYEYARGSLWVLPALLVAAALAAGALLSAGGGGRIAPLCLRAGRAPLGYHVARHPSGAAVIVPGRRLPEYLAVMCGLIRRYGAGEPTVADALIRFLLTCADVASNDPEIAAAVEEQARIIIADAEREVRQPADLSSAQARAELVFQAVLWHQPSQGAGPAHLSTGKTMPVRSTAAG